MGKPLYATIRKGITALLIGAAATCCIPTQRPKQQEALVPSEKDAMLFAHLRAGMDMEECTATDQQGRQTYAKILLEKSISGDKAQAYIEELAENAYLSRSEEGYKTAEDKIRLAKDTIGTARERLNVGADGEGNYTRAYEYNKEREMLRKIIAEPGISEMTKSFLWDYIDTTEFPGDSIQTFDEFLGPKDGMKFAGDCDDFSIALTTIYHGLKDYAEANKERDEFFKALAEGLDNYKIFTIGIPDHELNMSVTYPDSTTLDMAFEAIEPQDRHKEIALEMIDSTAYIRDIDEETGLPVKNMVFHIFNRDFSAIVKEGGAGY